MKSIMIIIGIIIFGAFAIAQVPTEVDTTTLTKIAQEHANTRAFVSTELQRARNEFFTEMDARAVYYEEEAYSLKRHIFFQLAMAWGGIVLFGVGITSFLNIKLERMRSELLARRIGEELQKSGSQFAKPQPEQDRPQVAKPQTKPAPTFNIPAQEQAGFANLPRKKSWSERRAEKKFNKRKERYLRERKKMVDSIKEHDQKYRVR